MQCFPAKNLTLGLIGVEVARAKEKVMTGNGKKRHSVTHLRRGGDSIIDLTFPIMEFSEGQLGPGMMSFPITFQIPEWLPASMQLCDDNFGKTMMTIKYILRAQVTPLNASDWDNG